MKEYIGHTIGSLKITGKTVVQNRKYLLPVKCFVCGYSDLREKSSQHLKEAYRHLKTWHTFAVIAT